MINYSDHVGFKSQEMSADLPSYSLRELARAIVQQYATRRREQNQIIFDEIIQHYCVMSSTDYEHFDQKDIESKCNVLFNWCRKTYSDQFRNRYKLNKEKFVDCLLGRGNPTDDLIIQLSIAFKLSPELCDQFLAFYGYLGLHPKNIYHLAIYSVLRVYKPEDQKYDQYDVMRLRYDLAKKIINPEMITEKELWDAKATAWIQRKLDGTVWTDERFVAFIHEYADELNGYQNSLLREHTQLTRVFRDLYNDKSKGIIWDEVVVPYSLFVFATNFCGIPENHFKEALVSSIRIEKKVKSKKKNGDADQVSVTYTGKYPTRQAMILLWLFAKCFQGFEIRNCPVKYTKDNQLNTNEPTIYSGVWGNECCDFDVDQYLYGFSSAGSKGWNGLEILDEINQSLQDYDWNAIAMNDWFDYLIYSFLKFKIHRTRDGGSVVTLNSKGLLPETMVKIDRIDGTDELEFSSDVPQPLQLLFALMTCIQSEYFDRMSQAQVNPTEQAQLAMLFATINEKYLESGLIQSLNDESDWKRLFSEEPLWDEMTWVNFEKSIVGRSLTYGNLFAAKDVIHLQIEWLDSEEWAGESDDAQKLRLDLVKQLNRIVDYIGGLEKGIAYPLQCTLYYKIDI
ncbi:MAG: hypothetical protein J6R82_07220 [Clostridia bacterium]|nr:hypothetical protein [Clostridia bacterium]